jgi:hypothetical protein
MKLFMPSHPTRAYAARQRTGNGLRPLKFGKLDPMRKVVAPEYRRLLEDLDTDLFGEDDAAVCARARAGEL